MSEGLAASRIELAVRRLQTALDQADDDGGCLITGDNVRISDVRVLLAALSVLEPRIEALRKALIEAGRNAGALLADDVSDEFLAYVPGEVKGRIEALERAPAVARFVERERCAWIAQSYEEGLGAPGCINRSHPTDAYLTGVADASAAIAAAIRTGEAEQ